MSENILDGINKIEAKHSTEKSTIRKKVLRNKNQNISFFSFIRLLILPTQIELKDHSIRVKDHGSDTFSLKQKHEFSRVFSPSASDFIFFSKSLEQFTENNFLILAVFGSLDIRRLFNYLNYNSYYIFEFDFEILGQLIQNNIDLSNEQMMPISDASSSTYITPKIHYLTNDKDRRNITIYLPEGYFSIIKTLKQMANDQKLTIALLSQISDLHKDKYNSILSSLSLSTKSLVTPKSANNDSKASNKLGDNSLQQIKEYTTIKSKNELITHSNDEGSDIDDQNNIQPNFIEKNTNNNTFNDEKELTNKEGSDFDHKNDQIQSEIKTKKKDGIPIKIPSKKHEIINKETEENNETCLQEEKIMIEEKPKIKQNNCTQATFLKQIMQNTSSSPNELSGIFDTLGSIIKRSENGWKQTDSELTELQSRLSTMEMEQTKEAEALRIAEENLEKLQIKLAEMKKKRIDMLNEKDILNSYVTRSISITTRMKKQVREVVDRSCSYEKKFDDYTKEIVANIESETSEAIQSHEIMTEMEILESEIEKNVVI